MNLEFLKQKMQHAYVAMEAACETYSKAEGDAVVQAKSAFESAKKSFDEAEAKYIDAKSVADAQSVLSKIEAENKPEAKNVPLIDNVKDEAKAEHDNVGIFGKWLVNPRNLSGQEWDAIKGKTETGVKMPKRIFERIFGLGKSLPYPILSTEVTGGTTDSGGGNTVPDGFVPQILMKPYAIPSLYDLVRKEAAPFGKLAYPRCDDTNGIFGGLAFTWKSTEGADKSETAPTFTQLDIVCHELSGWTECSRDVLRRSPAQLEAFLTGLFADGLKYGISAAIATGNGTTQPDGVVTSGTATTSRTADNKVEYADLLTLVYTLSQGARIGGMFAMHSNVEKYLRGLTDDLGLPLFGNANDGLANTIIGFPYITADYMPDLGATGDIVFGNFNNYILAVEEEATIERSDEASFKTGRVVFRSIANIGGNLLSDTCFSVLDTYGA